MTKYVTRRGVRVAVLSGLLPFLVGGCALNEAEPADPQQGQAAPSPETGPDLPNRPRDLPVSGLDEAQICKLIQPEQLDQLGIGGGNPAPKLNEQDFPGCSWLSESGASPSIGVLLVVAPMSIQDRLAETSGGTATTDTLDSGFGAVRSQVPGAESLGCVVAVDVAEGETLEAGLSWLGGDEMTNQDMCAKAKQAAEFAVSNLQAQG